MSGTNSYNSIIFNVPKQYDGKILKIFLRKECGVSARMLTKLKQVQNGVLLNGENVFVTRTIHENDCIELNFPNSESDIIPTEMDIPILFEDENIIVFDKPFGLTTHPVREYVDNTLANFAVFHALQSGENYIFRASNRLDKDTSGCVICAKNAFVLEQLKGNVKKEYYAVVDGKINNSGTIDAPIRLRDDSIMVRQIDYEKGKPSITHYSPIVSNEKCTLLKLTLETGRTHQIRVHMAHIGHPLLGDDLYGGSTEYIKRQALHCKSAEIFLPVINKNISVDSPFPEDFLNLFDKTGLNV